MSVARISKVARKDSAAVSVEDLIAASATVGMHIVIDFLFFNGDSAMVIEIMHGAGATWTDATGVIGAAFGANGGFVSEHMNLHLPSNAQLRWLRTGSGNSYVVVLYHLEA
jgi:hypothetical protein